MDDKFLDAITVYTGMEPMKPINGGTTPMDLVSHGSTMLQTKTAYHTAISVQKPRVIDKVVANVMNEARYAGEDWYWAWEVNDRKSGKKKMLEGGSIGLATAIAREWGNCVVDVEYDQLGDNDVFTTSFVDLENGTTFKRVYKQKRSSAVGKYDAARWEDMEFQKAQSKAIRNIILAGTPKWLQKAAIAEAKKGVISAIERVGLAKSRQMAVDFLAGYGVDPAQIEELLKKKQEHWSSEDVATLRGIATSLKDGESLASEVFPAKKEPENNPAATKKAKAKPDPQPTIDTPVDGPKIACSVKGGDSMLVSYCLSECPQNESCGDYAEYQVGGRE